MVLDWKTMLKTFVEENKGKELRIMKFFKEMEVPVDKAIRDLGFSISRKNIDDGECGSINGCAGALGLKGGYSNVLDAFIYHTVAYVVVTMRGRVRALMYAVPPDFNRWQREFDKIKDAVDTKEGQKALKDLLAEGTFTLTPPSASVGTNYHKKGEKRSRPWRSGAHPTIIVKGSPSSQNSSSRPVKTKTFRQLTISV